MNKKVIIALLAIMVIVCLGAFIFAASFISNTDSIYIDEASLNDTGSIIVDSKSLNETKGKYHADSNDENAVLVKNGGHLKLSDSVVYKTASAMIPSDDANYYGANSAILLNTNGTLDMSNVIVTTDCDLSHGIFVSNADAASGVYSQSSGENGKITVKGTTKANIKDVKITTSGDSSKGIDAAFDGAIDADNLQIDTDGQNSPAIATGPGNGQVHVKNSQINTDVSKDNGIDSPLIYSTGNITVENTKGTSYASQIAYIDGNNSIELINCDLAGYGYDNPEDNSANNDSCGVFIYQSTDKGDGKSLFKAKDSKLSIFSNSSQYNEVPMIRVTNTGCVIDLESTEFDFNGKTFLEVSGQNQWGTNGSNGGVVELKTNGEKIDGDVVVDNISSLDWDMKGTEFEGIIDSAGNVTVNVGDDSTWTLAGDSFVSDLKVSGNIDYANHKLTVGDKTYSSSNPFKG